MIRVSLEMTHLISLIPRTDEIDTTRENASFEDTEEETEDS
jgi:hypothetical protein